MRIRVSSTADESSRLAAAHAVAVLTRTIDEHGRARLVAATGSTQIQFLELLTAAPGLDWTRVELFHLDEYIGLAADHPGSFRRFLRDRLVQPTGIVDSFLIDGEAEPAATIAALTDALRRRPVDLLLSGIGENAHLAFNEPPADLTTDAAFTVVTLDETSRRQQVGEAWFAAVEDVPTHAITMTVPEILKAREIVCLAHGARKARAVGACFGGAPSADAPASALAAHPRATVFLDRDAASLLPEGAPR